MFGFAEGRQAAEPIRGRPPDSWHLRNGRASSGGAAPDGREQLSGRTGEQECIFSASPRVARRQSQFAACGVDGASVGESESTLISN